MHNLCNDENYPRASSLWRLSGTCRRLTPRQTGTPLRPAAPQPCPRRRPPWMTLRPKTPRCLDSWIDFLRKRVPDVSATRGLDSFQDLRLALHETVSSCPHKSGAAQLWTDTTSVSLALDDRSLLFGATGASHVHGKNHHYGHFTGLPMCSSSFPLKQRIVSNWE